MTLISTQKPDAPLESAPVAASRIVLRPRAGWQPIDLRDLWNYRELLLILALRDIKVRYKQTVLGAGWAIIQPVTQMIVFTVLGSLGNLPTEGHPRALFYLAGLLPWQLFATAMGNAGNSLVGSQQLITKIYFPRLVIPIAAVITSLIDFFIAFCVFIVIALCMHHSFPWQIVFMPAFVALAFLAALATGLWLSALNVEFRDVRYVIPFMIQMWFFITPILFPSSMVKTPFKRILLGLNPMSGVVEGFRWSVLGAPSPAPGAMLIVSIASILLLLVGGLFYFRRMEKTFADLV